MSQTVSQLVDQRFLLFSLIFRNYHSIGIPVSLRTHRLFHEGQHFWRIRRFALVEIIVRQLVLSTMSTISTTISS